MKKFLSIVFALMLLSGSAYIFDSKDVDYYMSNAIIMAYEFEKNWRKELK